MSGGSAGYRPGRSGRSHGRDPWRRPAEGRRRSVGPLGPATRRDAPAPSRGDLAMLRSIRPFALLVGLALTPGAATWADDDAPRDREAAAIGAGPLDDAPQPFVPVHPRTT